MKRRNGYALIELMAVLAVGSALLAIATGVIYTLFEAEEASRQHLSHSVTAGRLADQFRRDVHAATGLIEGGQTTQGQEPTVWVFAMSEERAIEYHADGESIERLERVKGKTQRREVFDLGPHWGASIGRRAEGETVVISLRMETNRETAAEPFSRALVIEAVLSMDHRFGG